MIPYIGDFYKGDTLRHMWNSFNSSGASITRSTDGTISVYEDGGVTQFTSGVTDTEDFDSLTGVHLVAIDTSQSDYEAGKDYIVVLSAATIDSQTVNAGLFSFSIENRTGKKGVVVSRGTALAGDSTTITLASGGVTADDVFNTYMIHVHAGTGAGQTRLISDCTTADDVVTVYPNWSTAPSTDSEYRVMLIPPMAVVDLPAVDGSGRVNVGTVRDTALSAEAGTNFNGFYDNDGSTTSNDLGDLFDNLSSIETDTGTSGVVLSAATIDSIWDEVLETQGSITGRNVFKYLLAALVGRVSITDQTVTFATPNNGATRVVVVTDNDKNRTSVTLSP